MLPRDYEESHVHLEKVNKEVLVHLFFPHCPDLQNRALHLTWGQEFYSIIFEHHNYNNNNGQLWFHSFITASP